MASGSGRPNHRALWAPPVSDHGLIAPDSEELESLLEQAVKRQMISDVPVGVFCQVVSIHP